MTTQELVERLRDAGLNLGHEAMNKNPWEPKIPPEQAVFFQAADRLSEMDAENKRLREALGEIAKQVPAKDMDEDYYEAADFEDGYDRCVFAARAALEHQQQKGEGL